MSVFALTSVLLGVVGVISANHEVEELFDARIAQQARLLIHLAREDIEDEREVPVFVYPNAITNYEDYELSEIGHHYESKIYFRIWRNDKVIMATDSQDIEPQVTEDNGFGYAENGQYRWRTFVLDKPSSNNDSFRIVVAERLDVRAEMVTEIILNSMLPEIIGWPLLAFLVWFAVSVGLEPLKQLADRISLIEASQLKPVSIDNVPSELAPVQQALNTLLHEIDDLMAREKRWIADAAHELRTPLAILKLHAQNAESAVSEEERQSALVQLKNGVDRSTRIVAQLLSYARIESQLQESQHTSLDVMKVTRRIVADLYPMVWDKQITMEIDETANEIPLSIEENHLEVILQNLISNAVKFTPAGGTISIAWKATSEQVELLFKDSGCGVTEDEMTRLAERFYRGSDHSGAGLGLSIVATLVNHYRANLSFTSNVPHGLVVQISFPTKMKAV